MENFWCLLKRSIHGAYVGVEPFHLFRYVDEQAFRYNNRKDMNDSERLDLAVFQIAGSRLTYKELTGHGDGEPFSLSNLNGSGGCSLLRFGPDRFGFASTFLR